MGTRWLATLALLATVAVAQEAWELVPLRTAAQRDAGMAGGEMGQMAFTLAISERDPQRLAMGIDTAAVYVSEDGGRHWELRRRGIVSNGVQSVAFDPVAPEVMWAAALRSSAGTQRTLPPDPKYYDADADGIHRSLDGGRSWTRVRPAAWLRGQAQNAYFAFDAGSAGPQGCRTVYVATHDAGLLRTTDGGETWTEIGPGRAIYNAVIRGATGTLWLAADEGLWRSDDDGATWREISAPATPVSGLAVHPSASDRIWVALGRAGVYRTSDGGQTWSRGAGLPSENWTRLALSPAAPETIYVDATMWGGPVPYVSHDGGANWQPNESREPGFYGSGIYWGEGLVCHPTEPLVAYHLYPVRETRDGGRTWQVIGSGVSGSRRQNRTSIAFRPDEPDRMMFFHTDHGATLTTDGGDSWTYVTAPRQADIGAMTMPGGVYDPAPGSRRVIAAVGGWSQQRLCVTEDDGGHWTVDPDSVDNYRFFAWHPQDPSVVYVGTATAGLRSEDGGRTWRRLTRPLRAVLPANGDVVYAVVVVAQGRCRVERSTDRGETWRPLSEEIPHHVYDIDVDPRDPERVYAATGYGGVWVHDATGWAARGVEHGLERDAFGALVFQCVAADPTRPGRVYAGQNHCWRGTARGVYMSDDYGASWRNITANLGPDLTVWAITVSPHDGTVWLGTDYGNWRLRR